MAEKDYKGPWYFYIGASRSNTCGLKGSTALSSATKREALGRSRSRAGTKTKTGGVGERGQDEDEQRFQACNILKRVRPVKVVSIEAVKGGRCAAFKTEKAKALSLMHEYGVRYARGGSNSNFNVTLGQEHYIERYLRHVTGKCTGCGEADHYAARCPTTTACYR